MDPAGEALLGGGETIGRVAEEKDPRVIPGELWSWVEATPGEPTGSSGKGLISDSGIAEDQLDRKCQLTWTRDGFSSFSQSFGAIRGFPSRIL